MREPKRTTASSRSRGVLGVAPSPGGRHHLQGRLIIARSGESGDGRTQEAPRGGTRAQAATARACGAADAGAPLGAVAPEGDHVLLLRSAAGGRSSGAGRRMSPGRGLPEAAEVHGAAQALQGAAGDPVHVHHVGEAVRTAGGALARRQPEAEAQGDGAPLRLVRGRPLDAPGRRLGSARRRGSRRAWYSCPRTPRRRRRRRAAGTSQASRGRERTCWSRASSSRRQACRRAIGFLPRAVYRRRSGDRAPTRAWPFGALTPRPAPARLLRWRGDIVAPPAQCTNQCTNGAGSSAESARTLRERPDTLQEGAGVPREGARTATNQARCPCGHGWAMKMRHPAGVATRARSVTFRCREPENQADRGAPRIG